MNGFGSVDAELENRTTLRRLKAVGGPHARGAVVIAAAAVLSAAGAAASLAANAPVQTRWRYALLNALIIFVPIGVGVYARQRAAQRRFGGLLIVAGLVWSTAALAQADASLPYSVGRLGGWCAIVFLVCLVLAYPTGELTSPRDRRLAGAALALLCLLYLPTAVLVDAYPVHTPWSSCRVDCPANAFMLAEQEPAFIQAWIYPLREALTVGLFAGVSATLVARMRHATRPQRQMLAPVLTAAIAQMLLLVVFVVARRGDPGASAVDTLGWLVGLCVPGVALGFLVGLVRWRLYVAGALQQLAVVTRRRMNPDELRKTLAHALDDPSVQIAWRRDGRFVDPTGEPVEAPAPGARQTVTELRGHDTVVGALVHDGSLADDPEFIAAVATWTLSMVEQERLRTTVSAGLHEFELSRARLLREVDDERRRLERALHDGAQQRLVALGIRLELARENLSVSDAASSAELLALESEVDETLAEIRSLARGVYPSLLSDLGLPAALQAAAGRAPINAHLDAADIGRYSAEIESAVYFTCLEALQNAVKHAHAATGVWITLRANDALTFEVRDDGAGFDQASARPGVGLTNMHERLASIAGTLRVHSAPGRGTRITGSVPVA